MVSFMWSLAAVGITVCGLSSCPDLRVYGPCPSVSLPRRHVGDLPPEVARHVCTRGRPTLRFSAGQGSLENVAELTLKSLSALDPPFTG